MLHPFGRELLREAGKKEMMQMMLLCGTGEAQPSSAGCTAGAEPLWAVCVLIWAWLSGPGHLAHLPHGNWLLCSFSQLPVSCGCVKSKCVVSWGSGVLEAETCLQMVWWHPARSPGHGSLPRVSWQLWKAEPLPAATLGSAFWSGTAQSGPG